MLASTSPRNHISYFTYRICPRYRFGGFMVVANAQQPGAYIAIEPSFKGVFPHLYVKKEKKV